MKRRLKILNQEIEQYVEQIYPKDADIERALEGIRNAGMPEISVNPGYGRLLTLLVKMSGAKTLLEIGALGGASGIYLSRGLPANGRLISLELKQEFAEMAHKHMKAAGFGDVVEYRIGEALDHLEQLKQEGVRIDFFFIDADKGNYPNYLDYAMQLANPGAIIVADNTLLKGRVADPERHSPSVDAMRKFNQQIAEDPRLDSTLLPAYDGLAIARVKQST